LLRIFHALESPVRVNPRHRLPIWRRAFQPRVVNDRSPVLLRRYHGLDVNEGTIAIKREPDVAAKAASHCFRETDRGARSVVRCLHATLSQGDEKRLVGSMRGIVEEGTPALRVR